MTYKEAAGSLRFLGELHYAEVYSPAPGRDIQPQAHRSLTRNMAPFFGSVRPWAGEAPGWDLA